jgi:hypothetical protein
MIRQQYRQCTPDGSLEILVVNGAFTSLNGEFYFDPAYTGLGLLDCSSLSFLFFALMEDNDNNQIGHHAPPDLSTKPVKGILKKPSKFIQDPASARYVPLDHE